MASSRKMHLVAYLKTGPTASYAGRWRHPSAPLHDIWDAERYEHIARCLEVARFDAAFFTDGLGLPDLYKGSYANYIGRGDQVSLIDPMIVLPLMARVTTHLSLGSTVSTTFNQPYHIARSLVSLDFLSKGWAAWNVVTSSTDFEARNVGMDGCLPRAIAMIVPTTCWKPASSYGIAGMRMHWYWTGLSMPVEPRSLRDFVELVVPELKRRGLRPAGYRGGTLRENLGLSLPADGFATARVAGPASS